MADLTVDDLQEAFADTTDGYRVPTTADLTAVVDFLRARRAQDTLSDPAAPVPYLLAVVGKDTLPDPGGLVATWSGGDVNEAESYARDHGHEVVPLYLRAPGAVAAAPRVDEVRRLAVQAKAGRTPESTTWELAERILDALDGEPTDPASRFAPGDPITVGTQRGEYVSYAGGQFHSHRYRVIWPDGDRSTDVLTATDAEVTGAVAAAPTEDERRHRSLLRSAWLHSDDWRGQAERLARLLVRDRVALARVKAQRDASDRSLLDLAPPAPSAGEDEAAVERAESAGKWLFGAHFEYEDAEDLDRAWANLDRPHRDRWVAAARGPRTQDGA